MFLWQKDKVFPPATLFPLLSFANTVIGQNGAQSSQSVNNQNPNAPEESSHFASHIGQYNESNPISKLMQLAEIAATRDRFESLQCHTDDISGNSTIVKDEIEPSYTPPLPPHQTATASTANGPNVANSSAVDWTKPDDPMSDGEIRSDTDTHDQIGEGRLNQRKVPPAMNFTQTANLSNAFGHPHLYPNPNFDARNQNGLSYHHGPHTPEGTPPESPLPRDNFRSLRPSSSGRFQSDQERETRRSRSRSRSPIARRPIPQLKPMPMSGCAFPQARPNHMTIGSTTLWLGNLPETANISELRRVFSQFGRIVQVYVSA